MAERRYRALLIGNAAFPKDPHGLPALAGPLTDIDFLQQALTDDEVGLFRSHDVELIADHGVQQLRERIDEFYSSAKREDVLLLYYSGHGELDIQGTLYLCAHDSRSGSLRSTALSSIEINNMIDGSAAATTIIMLDCCHSGAFKGGPKAPTAGRGRYVLTSNRHTQLARAAAQPGHPSPFTGLLALGLRHAPSDGHLSVTGLYRQVHSWMTSQDLTLVPQLRIAGEGEVIIARRGSNQHFTEPRGPGSSDAGPSQRISEQFDRALRIAESIDDPEEKASALHLVAIAAPWLSNEIVARLPADDSVLLLSDLAKRTDDADLAQRWLDQAQPLVALIPDPLRRALADAERIKALARVASLLADADPDGGSRLMEQTESAARKLPPQPEYTWWLPHVLVEIANAGRDAHPYCSRRLIDLAEQIALRLKDHQRDSALQWAAKKVARADPERAERIIGLITDRHNQVYAWTRSIEAAVSDSCADVAYLIDAAEQALDGPVSTDYDQLDRAEGLMDIAIAAAAADPRRAEHLASRITGPAERAETLARMAAQVAVTSPDQARAWLEAASHAGRPTGTYSYFEALGSLAVATIDPALASQAAHLLVSAIRDHEGQQDVVYAAKYLAAVDPAQAVRLVEMAEARPDPLDKELRRTAATALAAAAVASADTDLRHAKGLIRRAWQTVHRPPKVKKYRYQVWEPLEALAGRDLHTAEQLIDQLPGTDRDPLLARVVSTLSENDPLRAEQVAQQIGDDTLRKRALTEAALSSARHAQATA
ncbi:caspase family protein [Streptomyces niveus]|uniref:caspase, EACC1-associated type n=1 Tax=Streptomyces niveus TaxID=193462 RepID=UPI00365297DF